MRMKSNVWKAYVFKFLTGLHFMAGVLVPFFTEWGKISFSQTMFLQSWFIGWAFILEVPTGAIADRFGRKASLVAGTATSAVGLLVYSVQPSFLLFLLGEVLLAAGMALVSGADEALAYDTLAELGRGEELKKILGRLKGFNIAGITVAAPIGSLVAGSLGLNWTMALTSVAFFFALILAMTIKEPQETKRREKKKYLRTIADGISAFARQPAIRRLSVNGAAIGVLVFCIIWTYQLVLKGLGMGLAFFGIIHAVIAGVQIAVINGFSKMEKIAGSERRYLLLSSMIPAGAFMLLGASENAILSIAAIMAIAAFGMTRATLIGSYIQQHIGKGDRATILSFSCMVGRLFRMGTMLLLGIAVQWSLGWTLAIIGLAIAGLGIVLQIKDCHLKGEGTRNR